MCSNNNGKGGGVSIFYFPLIRFKSFFHKKRKMRIHHYLLFTTQEKRFIKNDNEFPPLVVIDLQVLSKSASTTIIASANASDAKEIKQAQDTQT
jgi:hypothetical protein